MAVEVEKEVADIAAFLTAELQKEGKTMAAPRAWQPAQGHDPFATCYDRRAFLRGGAATLSALALSWPLQELMKRQAYGAAIASPYGAPVPTLDQVTGLPLIALPPGFRYYSHGWTGDPISAQFPGLLTPAAHDGMGVLQQIGPRVILCRNHEVGAQAAFASGKLQYSAQAGGGNTNLIFNTRTEVWERVWPSLSGTRTNCAGGITPFATWLSCEETFSASPNGLTHGWVFEVPALGQRTAEPIRDMGRFAHEAVAVDPQDGMVYLTEDAGSTSGLYRYTPSIPGDYLAGGVLEMLKLVGEDQANLRGLNPAGGNGAPLPPIGTRREVEWVLIDDPEVSHGVTCFQQGFARNGAVFRRLEGAWYSAGNVYFLSTDGGVAGQGIVFCLDLENQTLEVIYDSPGADALDNPDNLLVTPRGALILCEDNAGSPAFSLNGVDTERLVGLTLDGEVFDFAYNLLDFRPSGMGLYTRPGNPVRFNANYRANEWAGATFSPDGNWLFVNLQTPGVTLAITGPWHRGPF
jgi:secreted PhoX family phosphatase